MTCRERVELVLSWLLTPVAAIRVLRRMSQPFDPSEGWPDA